MAVKLKQGLGVPKGSGRDTRLCFAPHTSPVTDRKTLKVRHESIVNVCIMRLVLRARWRSRGAVVRDVANANAKFV